ncbi:GNAT family N-acetyltransferase [Paenibacillus methanolicus]|uniref:Acetyltransferase (GNAT) family protein n=1 Tax=Paenibacillus methanolicus TaxID=582686 RepID=A0A5S5CIH5_9BACL|nr:GNAT family N-acetyltransferase [Paenibacillus methanolicus]TYP79560.1 acetyltransferase (GNAT) family protein [Paenibacillus methanolicus]
MELTTMSELDASWWQRAKPMYMNAFGNHGGKTEQVIRRMFERKLAFFHVVHEQGEAYGMAFSSISSDRKVLVIDYLTVDVSRRGRGDGSAFVHALMEWGRAQGLQAVIIEVESDPSPDNEARIRFWEQCGFAITEYVHHYIWVPEPYRAMVAKLDSRADLPFEDGQKLFRYITNFHRKAYAR